MSRLDKKTIEDGISRHEANLASLIQERNAARERAANGEDISEYWLDKIDRNIADIENTIHNLRTKGRGYD